MRLTVFLSARSISRSITVPLRHAAGLAEQITARDLSGDVVVRSRDEIGQLTTASRAAASPSSRPRCAHWRAARPRLPSRSSSSFRRASIRSGAAPASFRARARPCARRWTPSARWPSSSRASTGASSEQSSEAVSHMDQLTQQNAALVEETAAGLSLQQQAEKLAGLVNTFRMPAARH